MSPRIRAGLTRARVVEAAARLADAGGLDHLTLTGLAAELGVRPPTLFKHVDGLADLRRELQLSGLRQMAARAGRAAVGRAGDDAVLALVEAIRAFATEHPGLYAASLPATRAEFPELDAAAVQFVGIFFDVMRHYGFLQGDAAVHAVRGLFSVVHGFIMLERAGTFGLAVSVDESFRWLVRRYLSALAEP
jgi:AcrR family transcriptional regulator